MKKEYVKPRLTIETFLLAQSIAAAGCVNHGQNIEDGMGYPTSASPANCVWYVDDETKYYTVGVTTGAYTCDEGPADEIGCYHNPNPNLTVWGS